MDRQFSKKEKRPALRDTLRAAERRAKKHQTPIPMSILVERANEANKARTGKVEESSHWIEKFDGTPFAFKVTINEPYDFYQPPRQFQFSHKSIDTVMNKLNVKRT